MISPVSPPVVSLSFVVSLPALWSVWRGSLPLDVGLSRLLVVQLICWLALSAAARAFSTWADADGPSDGAEASEPDVPAAAQPSGTLPSQR